MISRVFVLLCFTSLALGQSQTFWIPQFAHGGSAGVNIRSTITIVNNSDGILNPARAEVRSFDTDGNPADLLFSRTLGGQMAASSVMAEVPGNGAQVIPSLNENPDDLSLGWANVIGENISVEMVFQIFTAGQLTTTTSVIPGPLTDSATVIVNVGQGLDGSSIRSSLALLNPPDASGSVDIDFVVYDRFGQTVGSASLDGLQPGARVAQNWVELVPALAGQDDFVGTASLNATGEISVLALRQDGVELTTQQTLAARE